MWQLQQYQSQHQVSRQAVLQSAGFCGITANHCGAGICSSTIVSSSTPKLAPAIEQQWLDCVLLGITLLGALLMFLAGAVIHTCIRA